MKQRRISINKNLRLLLHRNTSCLYIQGPLGQLQLNLPTGLRLHWSKNHLFYETGKQASTYEPSIYDLLKKMIKGVLYGYRQELNIVGVGYRVLNSDSITNHLEFNLGRNIPDQLNFISTRIQISCFKRKKILLKSCDFQYLNQTSINIQSLRPPATYKKKGIFFKNQIHQLKPGKIIK